MSKEQFDNILMDDIIHIDEDGQDVIKGKILTIYPPEKYFSDKNNYKILHSIYVKDMFNMVLSNNRFPSAHENLSHIQELTHFIPTMQIVTGYYTFIYFYILRAKYKSAVKGFCYSMIFPLSCYFVICVFKNAANFYYDNYLRDAVFTYHDDKDILDDKILMYKSNVMQYNRFLYIFNKNQKRLMYTDKQILDYDYKAQQEKFQGQNDNKI